MSEEDLQLSARYWRGPYDTEIAKTEEQINSLQESIQNFEVLREKDTGLAPASLWNIPKDSQLIQNSNALRVGNCIQILQEGG